MVDEGGRRNAGSWVWALGLAALDACGPDANVNGTGGGSGGSTVHTLKVDLGGNGSVSSNPAGIEDGATVAGPLPGWLAPRAGNQLFAARSGKAYATWGGGGQCVAGVEILAASTGKSCGCVKVPNLASLASVGRDGSLIVPGPGPNRSGCSYDLYPKLLR